MQFRTETISDDRLPAAAVLRRYRIVDRTLKLWLDNPSLNFPRPLVVNGRRYFRLTDLEQWERSRAANSYSAAA